MKVMNANAMLEPNLSGNISQQTVLTIYAHADDEVLPAAGTLRLMSNAGWKIHCLILTDGNLSRSPTKNVCHHEAEEAGKLIGATYEFYALEEGNFSTQAVIKVTEEAIKIGSLT